MDLNDVKRRITHIGFKFVIQKVNDEQLYVKTPFKNYLNQNIIIDIKFSLNNNQLTLSDRGILSDEFNSINNYHGLPDEVINQIIMPVLNQPNPMDDLEFSRKTNEIYKETSENDLLYHFILMLQTIIVLNSYLINDNWKTIIKTP